MTVTDTPLLSFRYYGKRPRHITMYCGACGVRLADGTDWEQVVDLAGRNATARPCCNQWTTEQAVGAG